MEFDEIIVGAGSSGAVLAARLSEDTQRKVLLIEAGPDYAAIEKTPPSLLDGRWPAADHDWGYTAGRAEDQVRRNRATQYFSYPDFKFDRLRQEAPGAYESYVDIGLDEWIELKIAVQGAKAKLYVNGSKQPILAVNDLKHGADVAGAIGLWVDVGTEGYFTEVRFSE